MDAARHRQLSPGADSSNKTRALRSDWSGVPEASTMCQSTAPIAKVSCIKTTSRRCIGCITLALRDPRQPGRQIRSQEQANEAGAVLARQAGELCALRFLQEGSIEHDRAALGKDTLRGICKYVIHPFRVSA